MEPLVTCSVTSLRMALIRQVRIFTRLRVCLINAMVCYMTFTFVLSWNYDISKERTHSFLSLPGRKFDKNGELIEKRTRWSEPAIKMFQEKAKCLVEQFSKYKVLNKFHVSKKQHCCSFCIPAERYSDRYALNSLSEACNSHVNVISSILCYTLFNY